MRPRSNQYMMKKTPPGKASPISVHRMKGVRVDASKSNITSVCLSSVSTSTTGRFRCEVCQLQLCEWGCHLKGSWLSWLWFIHTILILHSVPTIEIIESICWSLELRLFNSSHRMSDKIFYYFRWVKRPLALPLTLSSAIFLSLLFHNRLDTRHNNAKRKPGKGSDI